MDTLIHIMTPSEWLTFFALILGPIFAVFMTRFVDNVREKRNKRLQLFKILMRTRGTKLNPEHVGALNLVEIEFYNERRVQDSLERYFQHLNNGRSAEAQWDSTLTHLFTKLLSEMARSLGYQIEQLQILTGGYAPQGWEAAERRLITLQDKLIGLLDNKTSLTVNPGTSAKPQFTPPPGFPPVPN